MARVKATGSNATAKVRFIEPMYAMAVQKLPNEADWLYEVKFDAVILVYTALRKITPYYKCLRKKLKSQVFGSTTLGDQVFYSCY